MDIAYGEDPEQKLDFFSAPGKAPAKLLVYLHGGGWVTGNRRGGRQLAEPFGHAGYAVACIGYRLIPHTNLAGCIADSARAIAFLLTHAAELGIDPNSCVLMGHSAGGHMAALLATDDTHLHAIGTDTSCLGAIVALDGIFDVTTFLQKNASAKLQAVFGEDPADWARYSPITHIDTMRANPQFCLICEDVNASFVPQTTLFETALKAAGKKVAVTIAPGLKHAELMLLFKRPDQPMLPFVLRCLSAAENRN